MSGGLLDDERWGMIGKCPVCELVRVLEYARTELDRLELAYRRNSSDVSHQPNKVTVEKLQKALDLYRIHVHRR
jgi:hypothetical protein